MSRNNENCTFSGIFRHRHKKFDTILMNNACRITELDSLPALAFAPSSMILFGVENRSSPDDRYRLFNNCDVKYKQRTIFHWFGRFARN